MAMARPVSKSAFRIFPTPKYLRIIKKVAASEITSPVREFAKIIEKVKKRHEKVIKKNKGIESTKSGLTK